MAIDIDIDYSMGGVLAWIVSGVLPVGVGDPLPVNVSSVGRCRASWRAVVGYGVYSCRASAVVALWALWRAVGRS